MIDHVPEAYILAGGLGLRLRSVVGDLPKSLAPVGGHPFLHYLLCQLRRNEIRDVTLCIGYGGRAVRAFAGSGAPWDLRLRYSEETVPLGTGGAIRLAIEDASAPEILILNGDSFFDVPIASLIDAHRRSSGAVTIAARSTTEAGRYGSIVSRPDGTVTAFDEKVHDGPAVINGGLYVMDPAVLAERPADTPFSLERDLFPALLSDGSDDSVAGGLQAAIFDGFFVDIGVPDDHARMDAAPSSLLGQAGRC